MCCAFVGVAEERDSKQATKQPSSILGIHYHCAFAGVKNLGAIWPIKYVVWTSRPLAHHSIQGLALFHRAHAHAGIILT